MAGKKVLIIDDDKEFLSEAGEMLHLSGYSADTINDSATALGAVRRSMPDIILLDLKMDISGFQVAMILKQFPDTANIPIIAITGYFTDNQHLPLMQICGIATCLKKPVNPLEVISAIEKII